MSRARLAAGWLFALAATSAVYASVLFVTGGFETDWLGLRLRSRAWQRPAAVAIVLFLSATTLFLRASRDGGRAVWERLDSANTGRLLAIAAVAWALVAGARYGTFAAGGADSFGYVSQARLFARGELTDIIPLRPEFTWRDAPASLIPLAYRSTPQRDRMAPVYPPGLSLVMSAVLPLGERAMYGVVPLFGGLALLATAAAGRRLGDPLAGGVAAMFVSVSATFLLMQFAPMSDVPVTAMWLCALLCAAGTWRGAATAAGVLAGLAVLTRPNLAPLVLVVAALCALGAPKGAYYIRPLPNVVSPFRGAPGRVLAFCVPLGAAVALLLWIQWQRFGHPLASGYGPAADLFASGHVAPNAASYAARITTVFTPMIWLWLAAPALLRWGPASAGPRTASRAFLLATIASIATVWGCYLPYLPFEAWHFTRFLLPAIPLMLLLSVFVVFTGIRRLPSWLRPAAASALVVLVTVALVGESRRRQVFASAGIEQKYPQAARYIRDHAPEGAYVLALQHSGSVRYYSGRSTIRWDIVGADQLDLVVDAVGRVAGALYVVVDEEEVPMLFARFEGQSALQRLTPLAQFGQARIYVVE